jgi:uncharacterized membrane protein
MVQRRIESRKFIANLCLMFALLGAAAAFAQTSDALTATVSDASGASTPKEIRKAQRKAARAKKNAELKTLEKNGYQPGGDLTNYPQNLQNAEHKASGNPANTAPAAGQ